MIDSEFESHLNHGSAYHTPVLCKTVVANLVTDADGTYIDGTVGGGGHAEALLERLSAGGRVIGLDRDGDAIRECARRLDREVQAGRLVLVRSPFSAIADVSARQQLDAVDGVLLDLGLSSHQIDEAERGFSFMADAGLDMRMDDRSVGTARAVVNEWSEEHLASAIRRYGEERHARRIAKAIVEARPLGTTRRLAEAVESVIPARHARKSLARVFQAIRIAVNDELVELPKALDAATEVVRVGGRLVVISYHSLEDRMVKRYLASGSVEGERRTDVYGNVIRPWTPITRRPIRPADAEVEANPRSRSARLRVGERNATTAR